MGELNYENVFKVLVRETADYLTKNNLQAMVLGISGGIDSTVVAAICHEVSKQTGIPLIGRSLPIKNKEDEFDVSELVGNAFCDDFKAVYLGDSYHQVLQDISSRESEQSPQSPIANGNIQARLRMIYLYNLASIHKGLVMSTDNQTEYQLGFWTLHGDVGDFDPIQDLWKTEVYELAAYIHDREMKVTTESLANKYGDTIITEDSMTDMAEVMSDSIAKCKAIEASMALTPTDGLGISNSDLDQIGAKSYADVDDTLSRFIPFEEYRQHHGALLHPHDEMAEMDCWDQLVKRHGKEVVNKVWARHKASAFKREKSPMYICREKYNE